MELPVSIFLVVFFLILLNQLGWFGIAWQKQDNGLADVGWGIGFVLSSWAAYIYSPESPMLLMAILVTLWAFRLSLHIYFRNKLRSGEDWRYKAWREEWGSSAFQKSLTRVFLLQGFFLYLICLPILVTAWKGLSDFSLLYWIGALVFLFGFLWESIADFQLYRFKKQSANSGKILSSGLWNLSRHPNYFGEIVLWWGIFLMSTPAGMWWISIVGPTTLSWLITRVSGVPMLERKQVQVPGFQESKSIRPALVPNFNLLFKARQK
ncbi:MAG: DUF1295 domain-containing protein [Saprospiraceae bacterium]|nr:DUF1295 domain-containing protein [Saprospiraceae bacterium]